MNTEILNDSTIRYIYVPSKNTYHDKRCKHVALNNETLQFLSTFPAKGKWCKTCYRNALIRMGTGDSNKKMKACYHFFQSIEAQNKDIKTLFVDNQAVVEWCHDYVMQLQVKDDKWQIRRGIANKHELWHNNYIVLEDGSRLFEKEFHRQTVPQTGAFYYMVKVMVGYSWETQIHNKEEKKRLKKEAEEMLRKQMEELERKKEEERKLQEEMVMKYKEEQLIRHALRPFVYGPSDDTEKEEAMTVLKNKFEPKQLKEIMKGIEQGFSLDKLGVYAKAKFTAKQMYELRTGLKWHISKKGVKSYADHSLTPFEMKIKKWKILKEQRLLVPNIIEKFNIKKRKDKKL